MRVLTFEQLKSEKGIAYSRDHLRRKCLAGEFPKPMQISDRRIAWDEADVDQWLEEKKVASTGKSPSTKAA